MLKTDAQSELKAYIIFTLHTKHTKILNKSKMISTHSKIRSDSNPKCFQFDLYYFFLKLKYKKSGEICIIYPSMRIKLCKAKSFRRKKNFWKMKSQHNQYYKVFDSRRFEKFLWPLDEVSDQKFDLRDLFFNFSSF